MKIAEVRQKSTDELKGQVKKIHEEHFNLRFRRVTDVIENPQALRELRRDLARIHTVIRQREIEAGGKAAPAAAAPAKAAAPAAEAKPAAKAETKPKSKGKAKAKPAPKAEAKAKPAKKSASKK